MPFELGQAMAFSRWPPGQQVDATDGAALLVWDNDEAGSVIVQWDDETGEPQYLEWDL